MCNKHKLKNPLHNASKPNPAIYLKTPSRKRVFWRMQDWFNFQKSITVIQHTNTINYLKSNNGHLNSFRRNIWKIQTDSSFKKKTLHKQKQNKNKIKGFLLTVIKIYKNPQETLPLMMKHCALPLRLKTQQRYPLFSFLLNTLLETTDSGIQKEIKIYRDWKERSKILLANIQHECLQKTLKNLKTTTRIEWL